MGQARVEIEAENTRLSKTRTSRDLTDLACLADAVADAVRGFDAMNPSSSRLTASLEEMVLIRLKERPRCGLKELAKEGVR